MADTSGTKKRLTSSYEPPAGAQSSVLYGILIVAIRAGLRGDTQTLERMREAMREHGIDIGDESDPRVSGFEEFVSHWLAGRGRKCGS